jgi:hypothetical protein
VAQPRASAHSGYTGHFAGAAGEILLAQFASQVAAGLIAVLLDASSLLVVLVVYVHVVSVVRLLANQRARPRSLAEAEEEKYQLRVMRKKVLFDIWKELKEISELLDSCRTW